MAIKVNGTEVINNSKGLQNVASIDSTTATTLNNAGISASASAGGVGAYITGRPASGTNHLISTTTSALYGMPPAAGGSGWHYYHIGSGTFSTTSGAALQSGTWKAMGKSPSGGGGAFIGLWIRIS